MTFTPTPSHYAPMPLVQTQCTVHFCVVTPLNKMNCEYTLKDNDMAIAVFSEMQRIIEKYLSQGDNNNLHCTKNESKEN